MSSETSSHTSKGPRNSILSTKRTWTAAEERTLIDGLKELCVNGWRVSEFVEYVSCGLSTTITRKVDPNAKNMNTKKWPMFVD
ncbi:hypothetical protein RDI58_018888 [Solanum bulbocastanum]|uniref:Uncharacterized protein n=1 Tax=Solanum bulbocastanum TaxID=147425 RepID=A0AAN8TBE4_SOLBU